MSVNVLVGSPDAHNLPAEYQEVEYIESQNTAGDSSGSYINTGYIPNENSKLVADVQFLSYNSSQSQYGSGSVTSSSALYGRVIFGVYQKGFFFGLGNQINFNVSDTNVLTQRHIFTIDLLNKKAKVDNTEYTGFTGFGSNPEKGEFTIFARNALVDMRAFAHSRCYNLKLYENNNLIHNFIPCYRKSDGVAGLYDTVNGVFYTNAGTGTFTKGDDIANFVSQKVKINSINPDIVVPSEYQEVEYIESTGTQWIDTGVIPTVNTKAEFTNQALRHTTNTFEGMFGSRMDSQSNSFCFGIATSNVFFSQFDAATRTGGFSGYDTNKHSYILSKDGLYQDGNLITTYTSISDIDSSKSLLIMACNYESGVSSTSQRFYACTIYENNIMIRNYVPCVRKVDGVAGLYNTVNGVFYTNAGTGTFLKGNDVSVSFETEKCDLVLLQQNPNAHNLPSTYQEVEYIESTGEQWIDTNDRYELMSNKVDLSLMITQWSPDTPQHFIGCWEFAYGTAYGWGLFAYNDDGYPSIGFGGSGFVYPNTMPNVPMNINTKYLLTIDKNNFYLDNSLLKEMPRAYLTTNNTVPLFCYKNQQGVVGRYAYIKFYGMQRYYNNTLVRNYIPCYRKSDNEIGLYDTVNDVFYTNAGTGTFEKGNDVNQYVIIKI